MVPLGPYLLSLPERVLRSASALSAGLVREIGNVTLPKAVRQTRLYQTMVESTLRFLVEQVGQVDGAYPSEGELAENFLLKRTLGDGIDLAGLAAFHASPVWVLAALADISGAGRQLMEEISSSLDGAPMLLAAAAMSVPGTAACPWVATPCAGVASEPGTFAIPPANWLPLSASRLSTFRDCAKSGAP